MPDYQVGPLLVSDSFNRADGAIGSTDGGILGPLAYQADGATSLASWEVAGNKAQSNHAGTALQPIWIDVGVSDYRIEIEVAALPGFVANIGVVGRYVDRSSLIWWGVNESAPPQRLYLQQRPTTADVDAINLVGPIGGLTAPGDVITVDFWGSWCAVGVDRPAERPGWQRPDDPPYGDHQHCHGRRCRVDRRVD